jgi:multicomponent Na+:H+ antiporter subunit B
MASSFLRLSTTTGVLIGLLAVLSVFMLTRGHHAPGGGFVGGILFASAIAIQLLAHGTAAARRILRVDPRTLVSLGVVLVAAAGGAGLVAGASFLTPLTALEVTGLGHVGTVLLFDAGVYFIVGGTALTILLGLVEEA